MYPNNTISGEGKEKGKRKTAAKGDFFRQIKFQLYAILFNEEEKEKKTKKNIEREQEEEEEEAKWWQKKNQVLTKFFLPSSFYLVKRTDTRRKYKESEHKLPNGSN